MSNVRYILLIAIIALAIYYLFHNIKCLNFETWQDYSILPYKYVKSGADPLYFYAYNRYRKPYRWPFKYFSSYPYGHISPLP